MNKSEEVISILVVDDDTTCLSVISAILRKWNYEVVTVKHPVDALCILRIKGGAFHLVVTDVHMPDMNGFELQQAIAQEFKLPVGLMSADDTEGVESKGMENGAAFFLMKPIRPDNLKDLWQFTDKKNGNQVVTEETYKSSNVITVSGSSVNEDKDNKSDYSREKSPIKEVNDKGDGNSGTRSKKVKVNWTISLHNRFLEALRSIGLERAVPKRILEAMNVPGLTRENVASHLQKYRIFLKRVSDASNKIQRSCDENLVSKTLLGSQLSSRNPSVPTISKFSQKNQNARQSFLRSIKGHVPSFNASFPSSSSYLKTQSPIHFNGQSNYLANPSLKRSLLFSHQTAAPQGLTSSGLSSMLGVGRLSNQRSGTSNISSASTNFKPLMSNYVGYKISDNRLITESAAQKEHGTCSNLLDKFTNFTGKSHCKNSGNSGLITESAAQKEYGKVSNLLDEFTNFTGKSHCKNSGISGLIAESEAQKEHGKGSNLLDKFTNFAGKPHCKNSGNSGLIAESAAQKEHGKGSNLLDKFTSFKGNSHCKYSGNSGILEEDISWSSVFDEIQDISSPFLPSDPPIMLDSTVENGENDSEFIQMYNLQDIDHILSTDQESLNEGTSSNKMIIQSSQPKLNGGENVMNFNFSGGLHQWQASPPVLSFHQTPIQQNGGENVMNFNNISGGMNPWQGSPSIPRFEGTPEQHQSEGSNLISDQCGISTEQSNTFPSSDELLLQRDDVEYLESLLAMGPLGENQGEIFKLN